MAELPALTPAEQAIYKKVAAYMTQLQSLGVTSMVNSEQFIQSSFQLDRTTAHKLFTHWLDESSKTEQLIKLLNGTLHKE